METNKTVSLDELNKREQEKTKTLLGAVAIMTYVHSAQISILIANAEGAGLEDFKTLEAAKQQRNLLASAMRDVLEIDLSNLAELESKIKPLLDAVAYAKSALKDEK